MQQLSKIIHTEFVKGLKKALSLYNFVSTRTGSIV